MTDAEKALVEAALAADTALAKAVKAARLLQLRGIRKDEYVSKYDDFVVAREAFREARAAVRKERGHE